MLSTSSTGCRLLLADDHAIVREGLRAILQEKGFKIAGEASDGLNAVKLSEQLNPDVVLLDVSMPLLNGIDAAGEILKTSPEARIILLTMRDDERSVLAGLRAGVKGYVLKNKSASNLVDAIETVCKGEIYLSPGVSNRLVDAYLAKDDAPTDPLSLREREVLQLLAEGKNVKEVGDILHISTKTAESHRANIMDKLDIHELAGLVRYAIGQGLVSIE